MSNTRLLGALGPTPATVAVSPWRVIAAVAAIIASTLLAGCQSTGGGTNIAQAREQALTLAANGQHAAAAQTLEAAITGTSGELRDALLLDAAREWIFAGNTARAAGLADQRQSPLSDVGDPATRLIGASRALTQRQPSIALQWLSGIARPYPEVLTPLILEQTGRAHFVVGDPRAAVRALAERELWLSSDTQVLDNHRLLWRSLVEGEFTLPSSDSGDPVVDGWLGLARLAQRLDTSPGRLRGDIIEWRARYPGHPANAQVVPSLLAQYRSATQFPERVALLLPLSGNLARPAQAIRDGFIGAVLEGGHESRAIQVSVYDTAAAGAVEAYSRALAEGAELVVGPLRKDEVLALSQVQRRVPTITLNDPGELTMLPGSDFYRYALAPEDEARQAALRATREGHLNLIALIPNSNWGERLLASVRDALTVNALAVAAPEPAAPDRLPDAAQDTVTASGFVPGAPALVDYGYYANSAVDFSAPIRRALRLDSSERRYDDLRRILGERVEFEPRRRDDVDALFVAASAAKAKLIRPQLRFHYAADLPLYMTSAALDPDPEANQELNEVYFADIPWLATARHANDPRWDALERYAPDGVSRARLYAFGVDAFGLIPAIWSGVVGNEVLLEGLTGNLRADPQGRIARELAILQLRDDELVEVVAPAGLGYTPLSALSERR
ncbi:MAG: penicillin-binding protein activator [Pseudomonadota bacterium]